MCTEDKFRELALRFESSQELPHFDKTSFRYKKKIFATLNAKENRATLKFAIDEQDLLCNLNPEAIFPVPNKWGNQGWTHVLFESISEDLLTELLKAAYLSVRPGYDFGE